MKDMWKFCVGDTIIKKHNSDINKFGRFTITDIAGGKYWYNDRIICDRAEQDEWELVEQYEPQDIDVVESLAILLQTTPRTSEEDGSEYGIDHFRKIARDFCENMKIK